MDFQTVFTIYNSVKLLFYEAIRCIHSKAVIHSETRSEKVFHGPWFIVHPFMSVYGEISRLRSGHAPLLLSPWKRGVYTALVKQVTDVIG